MNNKQHKCRDNEVLMEVLMNSARLSTVWVMRWIPTLSLFTFNRINIYVVPKQFSVLFLYSLESVVFVYWPVQFYFFKCSVWGGVSVLYLNVHIFLLTLTKKERLKKLNLKTCLKLLNKLFVYHQENKKDVGGWRNRF